jgi:hypothetical protein
VVGKRGLRPVPNTEFSKDGREMKLDSVDADAKVGSNLCVRQAKGRPPQDFVLSWREQFS